MGESVGTGLAPTPAVTRWLPRVLLACLVASVALFVVAAAATVLFPYGIVYGEALPVDEARRLVAGLAMYRPSFDTPPYVMDIYPPLYPLLVAGAGAITRLPMLQVGRALSVLAALAAGLLVGMIALRLTSSRLSGLVAAALFLGNPVVVAWAPLARIDTLALAMSLAALWILYRHWQSWLWLVVACLLVVASIYTRQTYALAVSMAGAVWLWHENRGRALVFVAGTVSLSLLILGLLNLATRGGFWLNIVVANLGPYQPLRLLALGAILVLAWPVAVVLAAVEIAQCARTQSPQTRAGVSLSLALPFLRYGLTPYTAGALLSALAAGKIGSDVNYFLELVAALSIWAAGALVWQPARQAKGKMTVETLLLVHLVWVMLACLWLESEVADRWVDLPLYDKVYQQVEAAGHEGPILADTCLEMVLRAGQGVYMEPFTFEQARRVGRWAPDGLIAAIEDRTFPLILLDRSSEALFAERWSEPITRAINDNYEGTEQGRGLVAYRPRQRP